jgi:hypothetical protein
MHRMYRRKYRSVEFLFSLVCGGISDGHRADWYCFRLCRYGVNLRRFDLNRWRLVSHLRRLNMNRYGLDLDLRRFDLNLRRLGMNRGRLDLNLHRLDFNLH